jgi:hypothetical protein
MAMGVAWRMAKNNGIMPGGAWRNAANVIENERQWLA